MGVEFTVEGRHPDLGSVTLTFGVAFDELPDDTADDWDESDDREVALERAREAFPDLKDLVVTDTAI